MKGNEAGAKLGYSGVFLHYDYLCNSYMINLSFSEHYQDYEAKLSPAEIEVAVLNQDWE